METTPHDSCLATNHDKKSRVKEQCCGMFWLRITPLVLGFDVHTERGIVVPESYLYLAKVKYAFMSFLQLQMRIISIKF